jgi:sugar transferase (PEP-CTERM/EpsH1 system associated)
MKVLFLTPRLPFPPVGGDKLRAYHFIRHIAGLGHEVTVATFVEHRGQLEDPAIRLPPGVRVRAVVLPRLASWWNTLRGLPSRVPLQVHYYRSRKLQKIVREELAGCDALWVHFVRMVSYLPPRGSVRCVVDLCDAVSLNVERANRYRRGLFALINRIEVSRMKSYELATIERADRTVFISEVDVRYLIGERRDPRIALIQNGVDLEGFPFSEGPYEPEQIAFLGNLRYFANVDAVLWFASEVLPRIRRARPNVRFVVIGAEPPDAVRALADGERVVVTGFVPSVVPWVQRAAVSVAPLRIGAGMQNKILESLALGTPVVASPLAAEGLDAHKFGVGATPDELAERVLELLADPGLRRARARAGRAYVEASFAWDRALAEVESCLTGEPFPPTPA